MQRRMLIVVGGALILSDPATAQTPEEFVALTKRVIELERANNSLRTPVGMVSAFDRIGERPCPDGWQPYDQAGARFIIGVGDAHKAHETGGAESHILSSRP
jgi:hypothetical protein